MIKETIINYVLAASIAGGGVGLKFYADHTYISMNAYEKTNAQNRAQAEKTNTQNRVWALQDQIKAIRRKAAREGRSVLTTLELQDIRELETEIKNLKGN